MTEREVSVKQIRVLVLDSSAIHTQLLAEALRRDRALEVVSLDRSKPVVKSVIEQAIDVLAIDRRPLALTVRSVRSADVGAFTPLEPEPV